MSAEEELNEKVEAYIDQKLDMQERNSFEQELLVNPALRKKVRIFELEKEARELLVAKELKHNFSQWKEEKQQQKPSKGRVIRLSVLKLSVAAVFTLLIGTAIWYWLAPTHTTPIAESYIAEAELTTRGNADQIPEPLKLAIEAMDDKDYDLAISRLEAISDPAYQVLALEFKAKCQLLKKDYLLAIETYQAIIALVEDDAPEREEAEWYLLVSYLAAGQTDYQDILEKLTSDPLHTYHDMAVDLSRKLD